MECALAKPQSEQKPAGGSNLQRTGLLPGYPHGAGYGMMGSAYGAGYVAAGLAQVRRYNYVSLCYCTLCNELLGLDGYDHCIFYSLTILDLALMCKGIA